MLKTDILTRLQNSDGFVSGQELCDELGVSRTAIWKAVNALKNQGFEIESVTNRGYRLMGATDVLSQSSIESALKTKWLGKSCYYFDEIDSTNDELKRKYTADTSIINGTLAVTDNQTVGKGRRGRQWETPVGVNIAMSFLLRPVFSPDKASMLTLLAALAVAEGTEKVTGINCKIKWPNDVIIGDKKYCGILTEMSVEPDYIHYVIVGIGINVNTESFPEDIADKATSIFIEKGNVTNRTDIVAAVLESFEKYYEMFEKDESLAGFMNIYNERLVSLDKEVRVLDPKGEYNGISRGINEKGELLVELNSGEIKEVYAGEVSVRGIYGYV